MTIPPPFSVELMIFVTTFKQISLSYSIYFWSLVVWWLNIMSFLPIFLRMATLHCYFLMIWGYFLTITRYLSLSKSGPKSSKGYIVPPATIVSLLLFTIFYNSSLYKHNIFRLPFLYSFHFSNKICFCSLNNANYNKNLIILLILPTLILLYYIFLVLVLLLSFVRVGFRLK